MENKYDDIAWAFPRQPHYYVVDQAQHFYEGSYGMSLRDYFAAKALPTAIKCEIDLRQSRIAPDDFRYDYVAESAYVMADAMLRARAK